MSVILAGKRDSRRRSTMGFGQNVVVEETSYQIFEVLSFHVRKRAYPPTIKITMLTFHMKKKKKYGAFWDKIIILSVWIIIRFWETAHLPLPETDIKTYLSLRAKCWLKGGVGG